MKKSQPSSSDQTAKATRPPRAPRPKGPNMFAVLKPYRKHVALLIILTIAANAISLWLPRLISHAIDAFARHTLVVSDVAWQFGGWTLAIFILTYAQNIIQIYTAERTGKDIRDQLAEKISRQSYAYIQQVNPSKLLTNLTSDIDSIKLFVAQAISSLIASIVLIIGASALLLSVNWKLGLAVLTIVPVIAISFFFTLKKVRVLFLKSREIIDRLNRIINESILGSALVRVLNTQHREFNKFEQANADSRDLGLNIVKMFSALIPIITFVASSASVIILVFGGHLIINGDMSIGDFASFTTYVTILIFPILIIGFMSNIIAQATASYGRVKEVLDAPEQPARGDSKQEITGAIEVKNLTIEYGQKKALKNISFSIKPGSKVAIIGPTAAGKSQLLYALTGLIKPTSGTILYNNQEITAYNQTYIHKQIGFVFQDSSIFNISLRENIGFSTDATDADLKKAIETAELSDFINSLPDGLNSTVSERGTSMSGGQKQRLMLARALAINPRVLLLDDFTARVDAVTGKKIIQNLEKNYPGITLISVTQKIAAVEDYDQIILLMEGEKLAQGTHDELLKNSPEYMQIYNSQKSTNSYELQAD